MGINKFRKLCLKYCKNDLLHLKLPQAMAHRQREKRLFGVKLRMYFHQQVWEAIVLVAQPEIDNTEITANINFLSMGAPYVK